MTKKYFSQKICVLSALLSLPSTALFSWFIMNRLYQRTPRYGEFVTGYTTWTAYYKEGDMTLAYLVTGGIIGFFLLYAVLLSLLSRKVSWLSGNFDRKKEYSSSVRQNYKKVKDVIFLLIFSEFSLAALWGTGKLIFSVDQELIFHILQGIVIVFVGIFSYLYLRCGKVQLMNQALTWTQLFLPLSFFLASVYEYDRGGEVIRLYQSSKITALSAVIAILLIGTVLWRTVRDKKEGREEARIYLASFLSLAVFASYTVPRGTISGLPLEMYHYGELSGPLHQFLSFGTIPYLDTMPIHGVCDYFQAAVWYGLFDGTYATFEPAMIIGCVVIAVITAAVYYWFVDDKLAGLLCILLFSLFGDKYYYVRWAFALPFLLIVFSKKDTKEFSDAFVVLDFYFYSFDSLEFFYRRSLRSGDASDDPLGGVP